MGELREEDELLAANRHFYEAFAARNTRLMSTLWAREHIVVCVHPGWHALFGREEVVASWQAILESERSPPIQFGNARAFAHGDQGYVVCTEVIHGTELVATNVFAREGDGWKLVHRHAAPCSRRMPIARPEGTLN